MQRYEPLDPLVAGYMRSDTNCYDLCLSQLCISIAGEEAMLFVTRVLPVDNIPASFIAQHPGLRPLAAHTLPCDPAAMALLDWNK